jgi:hypothetical protein
LPFSTSPRLTNDLDIFLQDDCPGAAPMSTPLSTPHVPLGFPSLDAAGDQTTRLGNQTAPRTEAGGLIVNPGGQTAHGTEDSGLLATQVVRLPTE